MEQMKLHFFVLFFPFIAGVSFLRPVAGLWPRFGHSSLAIYQELISVMHSLGKLLFYGPLIVKSVFLPKMGDLH